MTYYDTINHIKQARENILQLRRTLKEMDPASGVTVSIRRGVARDNDDVENDGERRPWVTTECSNLTLSGNAILAAITQNEELIVYWLHTARDECKKLTEFLATESAKP